MDEYRLYQLQVIRGKITSIIGRCIAAFLMGMFMDTGNPMMFVIYYILVSWCWIFIKATGNWLIGIVVAVVALFFAGDYISNQQETIANILSILLLCGIIILDIINVIRYIALRVSIARDGIAIRRLSRQEMKSYKTSKSK